MLRWLMLASKVSLSSLSLSLCLSSLHSMPQWCVWALHAC